VELVVEVGMMVVVQIQLVEEVLGVVELSYLLRMWLQLGERFNAMGVMAEMLRLMVEEAVLVQEGQF